MSIEAVERHLADVYGLVGTAARLPGEDDENFRIRSSAGEFVLRIAGASSDEARTRFILEVLSGLQGGKVHIPALVRTLHGDHCALFRSDSGVERISWLSRFITGRPLLEQLDDPLTARRIGTHLARLDLALSDLPRAEDYGQTVWDLTRPHLALALLESTGPHLVDHRVVRHLSDLGEVLPLHIDSLPVQVIHNDPNPDNVLLTGDGTVAFIDFGDAIVAPRVVEVAVAGSYLVDHASESGTTALDSLLHGYQEVSPLGDEELDLLPVLMRGRVALAILVATVRAAGRPERAQYILRHRDSAMRRLRILEAFDDRHMVHSWSRQRGVDD